MVKIMKPWSKLSNTLRAVVHKIKFNKTSTLTKDQYLQQTIQVGNIDEKYEVPKEEMYSYVASNGERVYSDVSPYDTNDIGYQRRIRKENTVFGKRKPRKSGIRI